MYFVSISLTVLLLATSATGQNQLRGNGVNEAKVQELRNKLNLLEEMVESRKEAKEENLYKEIQERKNRIENLKNKIAEAREEEEDRDFRRDEFDEVRATKDSLKQKLQSKIEQRENQEESNAAEVRGERINNLENKINLLKAKILQQNENSAPTDHHWPVAAPADHHWPAPTDHHGGHHSPVAAPSSTAIEAPATRHGPVAHHPVPHHPVPHHPVEVEVPYAPQHHDHHPVAVEAPADRHNPEDDHWGHHGPVAHHPVSRKRFIFWR